MVSGTQDEVWVAHQGPEAAEEGDEGALQGHFVEQGDLGRGGGALS